MTPTAREIRDHVTHWPNWQRDLWLGSLVFTVLFVTYIYLQTNPAAFVVVVGGGIWVTSVATAVAMWVGRREDRAQIRELLAEVDRFGELTDTLVGDALTLAAQLREANTRAWDAEHAPLADVVPIEGLRVVEDVPNGDDDIWLNLYDENGRHR